MNRDTLNKAISEAERFLKAAKACRNDEEPHNDGANRYVFSSYPSKSSGACKRASMDLTRALADLRRPA